MYLPQIDKVDNILSQNCLEKLSYVEKEIEVQIKIPNKKSYKVGEYWNGPLLGLCQDTEKNVRIDRIYQLIEKVKQA